LIGINAVSADTGDLGSEQRRRFPDMTEKLTQPVGGWTAWCLSVRGIPRETRNPMKRKAAPENTSTPESSHAG